MNPLTSQQQQGKTYALAKYSLTWVLADYVEKQTIEKLPIHSNKKYQNLPMHSGKT